MFANVWHFPHMCGKSHRRAYFPLSYRWLSSIKYLYCQILIHHMYVLVHICFIKQWHTLVLCWNRLPVEILPLMSLNELSTDPSTDLRFLYLYPLCIYVFFVYVWICVFVHWCDSVVLYLCYCVFYNLWCYTLCYCVFYNFWCYTLCICCELTTDRLETLCFSWKGIANHVNCCKRWRVYIERGDLKIVHKMKGSILKG